MVKSITVSILAVLAVSEFSLAQQAAPPPARGEGAVRAQRAAEVSARGYISPASRPGDAEIREEFLMIERLARLPADQRGAEISRLYLQVFMPLSQAVAQEQMISSTTPPSKLMEPRARGAARGQRDTPGYGEELEAAAAKLTPEQVADTIIANHRIAILHLASLRRLEFLLAQNREQLHALIDKDLASNDANEARRAFTAIKDMRLKEYTRPVEEIMIADGPHAAAAANALTWISGDPEAAKPLLDDIAKRPIRIASYQYALRTMLMRQPPDPILINLLESPDAEIRNAASVVLEETDDFSAIGLIPKLAADPDERIRAAALRMGFRLPDELFNTVRASLIPALSAPSLDERVRAAAGFAGKRDAAGANILLDALKNPQLPTQLRGTVATGVNRLLQSRTPVRLVLSEWGPGNAQNAQVIAQFEKWIASQAK